MMFSSGTAPNARANESYLAKEGPIEPPETADANRLHSFNCLAPGWLRRTSHAHTSSADGYASAANLHTRSANTSTHISNSHASSSNALHGATNPDANGIYGNGHSVAHQPTHTVRAYREGAGESGWLGMVRIL